MHKITVPSLQCYKKIFGFSILVLIVLCKNSLASGEPDDRLTCGVEQATTALYENYPNIAAAQASYNNEPGVIDKLLGVFSPKVLTDYTIPVVFHIIHGNGAENITDAQVQEAINQLNEDYNGNDRRKDEVFEEFSSLYANVGMSFVLARLDPNGNPTDGITRHYDPSATTQINNTSDRVVKSKYMWPRDKYLNIYVVRSAGGQSGSAWAFYPSQVDTDLIELDGVISSHWAIGRTGTATPTHYKILTHEIGHWANLKHTFENGCSDPGDEVADTPPTLAGSGCNRRWTPCGATVGITNSQNYMDYGYCSMMFTNGQATRMINTMNSTVAQRNNIYSAANLQATGITGMPVNALFYIEKNSIISGGKIQFNDDSEAEAGSLSSWQWSFPGGTPNSYSGQHPPKVTYNTAGVYSATLTVSNGINSNTVTKENYITVSPDIVMRNDVVRTCNAKFYDSGNNHAGTAGKYGNREDHKLVVLPSNANSAINVNFNSFVLENNSNCDLDHLKIYDGVDESAPLLGTYCGINNPGTVTATNGAGALTFVFHSDVKSRTDGWDADVTCASGQGGGNIAPTAQANGPYFVKATINNTYSSQGSFDLDGDIATYNWNFGDGNNSNEADPTHAYNTIGTYNASLTVTDDQGASTTQNFTVSVRANQADPLIVEANGPYYSIEGQGIDFFSTGTFDMDTEITAYSWDFGDGGSSTFYSPTYTYQLAGTYTATLTVTNADGVTSIDTATVTIDINPGDTPLAMVDACATQTAVTQGQLEKDIPSCVGAGSAVNFSIPESNTFRSLAITTAYGSGDIEVLFNKDTWPSDTAYTLKSSNTGNYECIYIRNLSEYWSYVSVKNSVAGTSIVVDFNTAGCRDAGGNHLPSANISAPNTGEVGVPIVFDGKASSDQDGVIVSYAWNFGDGNTADTASPSHTFTAAGTYTVQLIVTDALGATDTSSHSISIDSLSNDPPTAAINGPFDVSTGDSIAFSSAGSSDPENAIVEYAWNFGDGNTSNLENPSHSYASAGGYSVTLTVTDAGGLTDTASTTVTVADPPPSNYCASNGGGGYEWIANIEINSFSNPSGDGDYSDYSNMMIRLNEGNNAINLTPGTTGTYTEHWRIWIDFNRDGDFADSGESVLSNLSGSAMVSGNINIPPDLMINTRMRIAMKYNGEASSSCGDIGDGEVEDYTVAIRSGTIGGGNIIPTAEANGPYSALVSDSISFSSNGSNDSDGTIVSYTWNFGDGSTSTDANPIHSYANVGSYNVTLTVTDNDGATASDSATATASAPSNVPPSAEANGPYSANINESIGFSSNGSNDSDGTINSYLWNFGDGSNSTNANPTYSYSNAGTYTATLTVTDNGGATASDTAAVTINAPSNVPPTAEANGPYAANINEAINFSSSGTSDSDGTISSYNWNFGDGNNSSSANPSHSYSSAGTYTATLTVTDNAGATVSDTATVTITAPSNIPPSAEANGPYAANINQAINFSSSGSNDSDGTISSYNWDFGDGNSSTNANPNHSYTTAGTYTATLTVSDNNGATGSDTANVTISDSTPITYCASNGGGGYEWIANVEVNGFSNASGDGNYEDFTNLTINLNEGNNAIALTAGGNYTEHWRIWIDFNHDGDFEDAGEAVLSNLSGQGAVNGTITIPAGTNVNTRLRIAMKYNGEAVSSCGDIGDGEVEDYTVNISSGSGDNTPPTANANGPYSASTNSSIAFSSNGSMDPDGNITGYHWDFGDGTTSTIANPSHSYTSSGNFTVTLTITDNDGASTSDTTAVTISAANIAPTANANGPYSANTNVAINFSSNGSNDSDGSISSYNWDFGDGNSSTSANPSHSYSSAGTYTATLIVTDNNGATSSDSATVTVTDSTTPVTYCNANGGGGYEWIANVEVNGFSNASADGNYEDFTHLTINLNEGNNTIALTPGTTGSYTEHWVIWIDFNRDGDFTDAGETVLNNLSGQTTVNGTITIPAGTNVNTTMRIAMRFSGEASSSCGDIGDGEVEDYTVNIGSAVATAGACGASGLSQGEIIMDQVACINRETPGINGYYVNIPNDDTIIYISTYGGSGDADIYYNAIESASPSAHQYRVDIAGNEQTLEVTADAGNRYIGLYTDSHFSDVKLIVSTTPPTSGVLGNDTGAAGQSPGSTTADDPDCQLSDTDTSNPAVNMYTFTHNVTEHAYPNGWVRVRGTSVVNGDYEMKFCPPTYGVIKRNDSRFEKIQGNDGPEYGTNFIYNYFHFGTRASNTETFKAITTAADGNKAVLTVTMNLQNPTAAHPVQPSCNDLSLDADFDGIPDCAEEPGKTFYTMPLYDWGARKNQMDIFIEVDYMNKHDLRDYDGNLVYDDAGNIITDHGTEPKRATLDRVVEVYAQRGIHIHFDIGDKFDQASGLDPSDYDLGGGQAIPFMEYIHLARWTDSYNGQPIEIPGMDEDVMPQYFLNNSERDHIFYYILFANSQGGANRGSSGQAPDLHDRFMYISLGGTGWQLSDDTPENENMLVNAQASTVVHELGHIFGLSHDGFPDDLARNFKLNYPSAMNYLFQLQGGPTDKFNDIDYELMVRERYYLWQNPGLAYACNAMLNETHPDNKTWGNLVHGLRSNPADFHIGYSDGLRGKIDEAETAEGLLVGGLDHNCDGNIDNYVGVLDVNNDGQINQLWDYDDWGYLTFFFHYYNYDVYNEYDVNNQFLLEPNDHARWSSSPTDVKYPGIKRVDSSEDKVSTNKQKNSKTASIEQRKKRLKKLKSLKQQQAESTTMIGIKEPILPKSARDALHKAMRESRKKHRKK